MIPSAKSWVEMRLARTTAAITNSQPNCWYRRFYEAEEHFNRLSEGAQTGGQQEFHDIGWTLSREAGLFYFKGCKVLGAEGAVISPDNRLFAEFTWPPNGKWLDHSAFLRRKVPKVEWLKGWYATLVYPASRFYFHWMMETLPRMAFLADFEPLLDGVFVPTPLSKFHSESLEILGIGSDRLIPVKVESHFAPEHLLVPSYIAMYNPPGWVHRWYKRTYLEDQDDDAEKMESSPRIYVSRSDAKTRRLINEDEVMSILERYQFVSVRLSELTFLEQARLFFDAECIVGPHGAGLSNLMFCSEGTKVLEFFSPTWMAPCYMAISKSAKLDYHFLIAEDCDKDSRKRPQMRNIRLDTQMLAKWVDSQLLG